MTDGAHVIIIEQGATDWLCSCGYERSGFEDPDEADAAADQHLRDQCNACDAPEGDHRYSLEHGATFCARCWDRVNGKAIS